MSCCEMFLSYWDPFHQQLSPAQLHAPFTNTKSVHSNKTNRSKFAGGALTRKLLGILNKKSNMGAFEHDPANMEKLVISEAGGEGGEWDDTDSSSSSSSESEGEEEGGPDSEMIRMRTRIRGLELVVLRMEESDRARRLAEIEADISASIAENQRVQEQLRLLNDTEAAKEEKQEEEQL